MKVTFTAAAAADLDEILTYTGERWPNLVAALESRVRSAIARIGRSPRGARLVDGREGVRAVLLLRFPFRIFYRIAGDEVEILHIHHTARSIPEF